MVSDTRIWRTSLSIRRSNIPHWRNSCSNGLINHRSIAQLARAPALHAEGPRFEPEYSYQSKHKGASKMAKLHYFNFSWGYVESARMAMLHGWYHREGFDTVEEAAESFARCLMTQAHPKLQCTIHGESGRTDEKFCTQCGKELQFCTVVSDYDFAYMYFNGLYTVNNDEAPDSNTERRNGMWYADWECDIPQGKIAWASKALSYSLQNKATQSIQPTKAKEQA